MSNSLTVLLVVLVVTKIAFAWVLYRLAQQSGEEPLRWAALGLLLDVLGLLAWLCLLPLPEPAKPTEPDVPPV